MPVKKEDAQHAVELLQEYRTRLSSSGDKPLLTAVNRVIDIFQSNLFNALLDIQEFYEVTIQDENRSAVGGGVVVPPMRTSVSSSSHTASSPPYQPVQNSQQLQSSMAHHHHPSMNNSNNSGSSNANRPPSIATTNLSNKSLPNAGKAAVPPHVTSGGEEDDEEDHHHQRQQPQQPSHRRASPAVAVSGTPPSPPANIHHGRRAPPLEVTLERGFSGFGFSIAGGIDNPHVHGDTSIFITRLTLDGVAERDGRVRVGDVILSVNGQTVVGVTHVTAVEALKKSGKHLKLVIRGSLSSDATPGTDTGIKAGDPQLTDDPDDGEEVSDSESSGHGSSDPEMMEGGPPKPPAAPREEQVVQLELTKGPRGLGFSVAGGVGNEHVLGDPSIYITKVIESGVAEQDGRIAVGDRLLRVNTSLLVDVSHEAAVTALRNTGYTVQLTIIKGPVDAGVTPSSPASSPPLVCAVPGRGFDEEDGKRRPAAGVTGKIKRPSSSKSHKHGAAMKPESLDLVGSSQVHRVVLNRTSAGLGLNIIGGEGNEGIFISHIQPGGVADASHSLSTGDQIMAVNGTDVTQVSHETAALLLKEAGDAVELIVQHNKNGVTPETARQGSMSPPDRPPVTATNGPPRLRQSSVQPRPSAAPTTANPPPSSALSQRRSMFVRAQFDYDPSKDSGLPNKGLAFGHGDVLHVTNACDDEWWQARRVGGAEATTTSPPPLGVIPSRRRVERRERARLKRVNFTAGTASAAGIGGGGGDRRQQRGKRPTPPGDETGPQVDEKGEELPVLSYEAVRQEDIDYTRPLIVLGPLKEKINDQLLSDFPDVFVGCVPHTSRPRREQEIDGCDYHFLSSREAMERDIEAGLFIEAGQYQGNLYGTSVAAVQQVARQGRHCVLDVSGNAIRRLRAAGMEAIVVFVRASSAEHLRMLSARMTEDQAMRNVERLIRLEAEFAACFTAIVSGNSLDEIYTKVKDVINKNSGTTVWVSIEEEST